VIAAAEHRARSIGLGADRVLICGDAITEEAYLTAVAAFLGTSYERLDRIPRADCPLDDKQLIQAAAAGLLPLREGSEIVWIIAPRCLTARRLADPAPSPAAMVAFVSSHLLRTPLALRCATRSQRARTTCRRGAAAVPAAFFQCAATTSQRTHRDCGALGSRGHNSCPCLHGDARSLRDMLMHGLPGRAAALRLLSVAFAGKARRRPLRRGDDRLPIYAIICALYREANVVNRLVAAIRALDYPLEKLDVKFVLEADDHETRRALANLDLGPPFEIITAPPIGPRTKPKALNVALPFARGSFTVVYDAEDVPEPDQLRCALDVFTAADARLACVQASLTIDNTTDSWLARMFTAAYAGQFDAFLPGLAALHLPLPLGGSSNHFRTTALRRVGGWDPYNVTEDADLGIRLARLGYRSTALSSATYEEAPASFGPWLRQRTRWYKGWMLPCKQNFCC
jgi:hypothetical protein